MITNKEVIERLEKYFLRQDPQVVARSLAGLCVDIHRFMNIESLNKDELESLIKRSHTNCKSLWEFANNDEEEALICVTTKEE